MRRSRRMFEEYQSENFSQDERYGLAYKRVKRIKGFYVHAIVYILVNVFIVASAYSKSSFDAEVLFKWQTFSTALFWGIGLVAHGLSVFGRDIFFTEDWEQKKIRQYMDKEASNTNKWE